MNVVETIKRRKTTIKLIQDANGYWGWIIGKHTKLPVFFYKATAIMSAVRFIEA